MPDTTRTFIAVAVPAALAPQLVRLQKGLAPHVPEARWVAAQPFHVTLAFLGDVPHADLNAVCLAAAKAAAPFEPFELELTGVGAFPEVTRPRVIWTAVGGPGLDTLKALQAEIAGAVARAGYPTDSRPFSPHVTLGRVETGGRRRGPRPPARDLSPVVERSLGWSAGPFPVTEAVTFGSTLTRDGPVYAPLGRAPLGARKRAPG
jgi:2'-5' RNA ligase